MNVMRFDGQPTAVLDSSHHEYQDGVRAIFLCFLVTVVLLNVTVLTFSVTINFGRNI